MNNTNNDVQLEESNLVDFELVELIDFPEESPEAIKTQED
jgi:hypothetical protein